MLIDQTCIMIHADPQYHSTLTEWNWEPARSGGEWTFYPMHAVLPLIVSLQLRKAVLNCLTPVSGWAENRCVATTQDVPTHVVHLSRAQFAQKVAALLHFWPWTLVPALFPVSHATLCSCKLPEKASWPKPKMPATSSATWAIQDWDQGSSLPILFHCRSLPP